MEGSYTQEEYTFVYTWCNKHLMGKDNARHRENPKDPNKGILPFMPLNITDRKFRRIFNDIGPAQGFYSSSVRGYWVCPPFTQDQSEIDAVLEALRERKAKALSTIKKVDHYIKEFEGRYGQGQLSFA